MARPAQSSTTLPLPCGPASDEVDRPYWDGLRAGRLLLPRCSDCGAWREPGRILCDGCWSFAVDWAEVRAAGRIFTWIRSRRDFMDDLDVLAPYETVVVALDDVPVRLLGLLSDDAALEPEIGQAVAGWIDEPANAAWPVLRWTREGDR
ncbi:Zn-ribbon domain-containing OB-fold protein [Nocardioides daejeonensis]|uniref:Zn-ribbon domain-containing OB-fold protein n=1 Tax=Nocardioides daejeonensis TaxID=1046556 RepID=UPI000D742EFB|nr:zinc ribbon domain-containing protein [Nocardioides daejeonensis]